MQHLLHITQENRTLSIKEIASLYEVKQSMELNQRYVLINIQLSQTNHAFALHTKLAYTNEVYQILFTAANQGIMAAIKKYNWENIYNRDFAVRVEAQSKEQTFDKEREFASIIYHKLQTAKTKPVVNLNAPQTFILFLYCDGIWYCGVRIWQNDKSFLQRKPHLKPELHPTSLNPRLAKACINLVVRKSDYLNVPQKMHQKKRVKQKPVLLDPFCGVGGILVEAGLLGIRCIGIDNQQRIIAAARENMDYYGIKDYRLQMGDATNIRKQALGRVTAIVTDLPYGKNTRTIKHETLYLDFLKHAVSLTHKMVVMFPNFVEYKKLIKDSREWEIEAEFTYYLHKSLSKNIVLCKRRKKDHN